MVLFFFFSFFFPLPLLAWISTTHPTRLLVLPSGANCNVLPVQNNLWLPLLPLKSNARCCMGHGRHLAVTLITIMTHITISHQSSIIDAYQTSIAHPL